MILYIYYTYSWKHAHTRRILGPYMKSCNFVFPISFISRVLIIDMVCICSINIELFVHGIEVKFDSKRPKFIKVKISYFIWYKNFLVVLISSLSINLFRYQINYQIKGEFDPYVSFLYLWFLSMKATVSIYILPLSKMCANQMVHLHSFFICDVH